MAIPQFHNEGPDQAGGSASMVIIFSGGFVWSANDIIELIIATDGWVPVMTTANGFQFAQDPAGNTASVTTNGGVAGTNDVGLFVLWKRAAGSTTTTDPPPVFQVPSLSGGTSWCVQPNSFSGARTSGTPYTAISTSTVLTATTAVSAPALNVALVNCLLTPRAGSTNDDQAFNNWTVTGSAGPSGTGAPNTGWHSASGNTCAFTGAEGGFAAASNHTGSWATTTFGASTRQALISLALASVAEPAGITGTESGQLGASSSVETGTVSVTGTENGQLGGSTGSEAGSVTVTGSENGQLRSSAANVAGGVTVTGTESGLLSASQASITGAVTTGFIGNENGQLGASSASETGTVSVTGSEASSSGSSSSVETGTVSITGGEASSSGSSTPSEAGAVLVVGAEAGLLAGSALVSTGTVFTSSSPTVGAVAFAEKANTTAPNTGTLTTRAVYPAWVAGTTYTLANAVRVTNAGNCYELAQTGTAASSGSGPTGTGAAIVDGGCKWNFLAAGTGAVNTGTTGSFFAVSVGRGRDATSGTNPRDSNSNSYTLVNKSFYAGFPTSSAAAYVGPVPAVGGTGHTFSADFGLGTNFGGDEISLAGVEIVNGTQLVDHAEAEVSPVGNVCTSPTVHTTGPAVLVAFWWLNGVVQPNGFLHTATPGSGFTAQPLASGLMEIGPSDAGQVQMATHTRVVNGAGAFSASITTANGEGAIVHLLAIQGPTPVTGTEAGALGASLAQETGTVLVQASDVAALKGSSSVETGTVSVTGSEASSSSRSLAQETGVVSVAGSEAALLSGSSLLSTGQVGGSSGSEAAVLGGSLITSVGVVPVSGGNVSSSSGSVASETGLVSVVGVEVGVLSSSGIASAGSAQVTASALAALGGSSPTSAGFTLVSGAGTSQLSASQVSSIGIVSAIGTITGDVVEDLGGSVASAAGVAAVSGASAGLLSGSSLSSTGIISSPSAPRVSAASDHRAPPLPTSVDPVSSINNFTVPQTRPAGLRVPEFAMRQLIGWALGQVRSNIDTPLDVIDPLFAFVSSDVRNQFRQWLLHNQNVYLDVSWPRDPAALALIIVEPQAEEEDTSNTFLNDSVGTTYHGQFGGQIPTEAPAYGIPETRTTNIYIASDDDRLTLMLYTLVKFILVYNKMSLDKFYDIHNLSISGGVLEHDPDKLPNFHYCRILQAKYMTIFDFNGVESGPAVVNLVLNVAEFIDEVEIDTTVEPPGE